MIEFTHHDPEHKFDIEDEEKKEDPSGVSQWLLEHNNNAVNRLLDLKELDDFEEIKDMHSWNKVRSNQLVALFIFRDSFVPINSYFN